jgi:glycosyltransferase involved in cell wall biosynthesis
MIRFEALSDLILSKILDSEDSELRLCGKACSEAQRPMHVLLLAPEFPPINYAGLANYSYNTAKFLGQHNDVKVSVLIDRSPFHRYVSNVRYVLHVIKKINEMKKRGKLDIVYAMTFRPDFLLIGLYAKLRRVPLVFHGVGLDVYTRHPLFLFSRRKACFFSDRIICGANFQKRMIVLEGAPQGKTSSILGGVDTELFKPLSHADRDQARRLLNVNDKFVLLSLGRLVNRKGFDDAILALTYIGNKHDIVLLIVGDGPEKPILKRLVEKYSLGGTVRFLGFQPADYLPTLYNVADLLIAPFKMIGKDMEGTPLVVQEALACSTPVISTNTAGLPELIEDGKSGFVVDTDEPARIAEKILILHKNPELRSNMALEARKRAQQMLDWRIVTAQTQSTLLKALKTPNEKTRC